MSKLFTFLFYFYASFSFSQDIVMPSVYELPKKEKLSLDAFSIFKTNKYLDFKNKDILIEKINDSIFKKTDLNNYFNYKKDWEEIENETASNYKNEKPKYSYEFVDNTMIERYDVYGGYNVNRKMKTVYDLKGYVLLKEEKVFVGDNFQETRSTINTYDSKNRVTKIIDRIEKRDEKENSENIINALYKDNTVVVNSENGTIVCEFLNDKNAVGFISKLSPKNTADYFTAALLAKNFKVAKEHCTEQMAKKLEQEKSKYNQITGIKSLGGQGGFGEIVKITENWEITYSNGEIKNSEAFFSLIKQKNGWKIDVFLIGE